MTRRFKFMAITLMLGVTCGCAIRVGQPIERPAARMPPADTQATPSAVAAAEPPPTDPNSILTCDCLERR